GCKRHRLIGESRQELLSLQFACTRFRSEPARVPLRGLDSSPKKDGVESGPPNHKLPSAAIPMGHCNRPILKAAGTTAQMDVYKMRY
ncbi:hypothetical protein ABG768_010782, partial [Culter alburnus]